MYDRTILFLPAPGDSWPSRAFPLCDASAMALTGVLVDDPSASRNQRLAEAIAADPVFAAWCAKQSEIGNVALPRTAASLAECISPRLLQLLSPLSTLKAAPLSVDEQKAFANIVAQVATTAHPLSSDQEAYLDALVPHWDGEAKSPDATSKINTPRGVKLSASPAAKKAGLEAKKRWLAEIPGIQVTLPLLIAKLQQFADLSGDFAARLERLKLDALKEFAYGAGHELNNPLANIASRAQTLLREESHPERRRKLAAINAQAFRAHEMLADIMLFAKPPEPVFETVNLTEIVREATAEIADEAEAQKTSLRFVAPPDPVFVQADSTHLRVAVRALCQNALEAIGHAGNVTVEVKNADCRCPDQETTSPCTLPVLSFVQIIVTDDGPGIAPEIRNKIFDPFFSGREAGRGLGFGLSKCWRIVELHQGKIRVQSDGKIGSQITISLPAALG